MPKTISMSENFAYEEVNTDYTYPKKYRLKSVADQANILTQCFPDIVQPHVHIDNHFIPEGADGLFATLKWQSLGSSPSQAIDRVLDALRKQRNGFYDQSSEFERGYLRQHDKTAAALALISSRQQSDVLIFPAQLGIRYRGCSVRRAREKYLSNEFGLDIFSVGCILLTHPERFDGFELAIDCAGDDFSQTAAKIALSLCVYQFHVPLSNVLELRCCDRWDFEPCKYSGSATGFIGEVIASA